VPSHHSPVTPAADPSAAASAGPADEGLENLYDSYDEHLADDFNAEQRVRARSLLSEDEQRAEKRLLRRGRLTDRERDRLAERREDQLYVPSLPDGADRWSTWGEGELGPEPRPSWLVVADGAVDSRLGVVKTGKEADVHLVERWMPDSDDANTAAADADADADEDDAPALSCLLAEKIYRNNEHRNFHRDAAYVDGRRTRESRMDRAVANRTRFGLKIIAEQWAVAEFAALGTLWAAGAPVPYPVQRVGTELLIEFIGDRDGSAAPRLAALRPSPEELADLWGQLCDALEIVARAGYTHGDLSPWNVLVHDGRLVLIDLPQIVDLAANPHGGEYLARDVRNVTDWFAARALPDAQARGEQLLAALRYQARLG
jgi:RIO kinase 1